MELQNKSISELVAIYNSAATAKGANPVKKFSDKTTALKRVKDILGSEPKKAEVRPGPKPMFNFPPRGVHKELRKGTTREHLAELLRAGCTFEEAHAKTWGKKAELSPEKQRKATYEAIRLLHHFCGFGLRQEGDKIFLVEK